MRRGCVPATVLEQAHLGDCRAPHGHGPRSPARVGAGGRRPDLGGGAEGLCVTSYGLSLNFPFYFVLDLPFGCDIREPSRTAWVPETGGKTGAREQRVWGRGCAHRAWFKSHTIPQGQASCLCGQGLSTHGCPPALGALVQSIPEVNHTAGRDGHNRLQRTKLQEHELFGLGYNH